MNGKLITRFLYTIMWARGLATVAFSCPSLFLLLKSPKIEPVKLGMKVVGGKRRASIAHSSPKM